MHEETLAAALADHSRSIRQAIRILCASCRQVQTDWRSRVKALNLDPSVAKLFDVSFDAVRAWLARKNRSVWIHSRLVRLGQDLARKGVNLEHATATAGVFLEACLRVLVRNKSSSEEMLLGLIRLYTISEAVVIAEYLAQLGLDRKALEEKLAAFQQTPASSYACLAEFYEQERRQLSNDLHDELGHDLVMLKLYLEVIEGDRRKGDTQRLEVKLQESLSLVSHAIESVRRLVRNLGPAILEDLGFAEAVKLYARQFSSRTGIQVSVECGSLPDKLPTSHQVALYRVLQGALSNVLKHSQAKHVKVALRGLRDSVMVMVIQDDGVGFELEPAVSRSYGLRAMQERIAALGGKVHLESAASSRERSRRGTRIEVDLPLPMEAPA